MTAENKYLLYCIYTKLVNNYIYKLAVNINNLNGNMSI